MDIHSTSIELQRKFRTLMGRYATGVSVIATQGPDRPHGMTANSLASVSLDPLLLLFCAREGTRTSALIKQTKRFSVNVLSQQHESLSRMFAGEKGTSCDVDWIELDGTPVFADAEAVFVCDLYSEHSAGDHRIMVGQVIAMQGQHQPRSPLLYYAGRYSSLTMHTISHSL